MNILDRLHLKPSPRTKLIMLAVVAVLLPTTILAVIQFRSLVELEDKTKMVVRNGLRQTLESITQQIEHDFNTLARDTIGSVKAEQVRWLLEGKPESINQTMAGFKAKYPEIDRLFLLVFRYHDGNKEEPSLWVFNPATNGLSNVPSMAEIRYLSTVHARGYLKKTTGDQKHEGLIMEYDEAHGKQQFIFAPLVLDGWGPAEKYVGFYGLTLNTSQIQNTYLPSLIPRLMRGAGPPSKHSELIIAVFDEKYRSIFATDSVDLWNMEVVHAFGAIYPKWSLRAKLRGTTVEELARDNFQKNLLLTLFVTLCLILGIGLMLRAAAREMKLAQVKSTFVSNVSHELKTPLALIRLFAETLELGRVKSPEKAQEYYRIINTESRRLTQLINNILDFSKIEAGRKEYQFAEGNVGDVVRDVVKAYEYQILNAGFELTCEIQSDLAPARLDRDAIAQAVLNLLNNAVKYSAETKRIKVRVEQRGYLITIEVIDSGIGIPRSEQEKIFEKFYRVPTGLVHNTKGSGLGLALVKHIIAAHHGRIVVDSSVGKGSRFTILLPAIVPQASASAVMDRSELTIAENPNS